MNLLRPLVLMLIVLLPCLSGRGAHAETANPGVAAAQFLLAQATEPQRDASHNDLLLGLRQLEDPALLPLFSGLIDSPYLSMRVHGRLGAAAFSPQRRIDIATIAEIDDPRELVQVLSAAIDDELIDNNAMATLLTWDGLDLPLRQAIALRLMGAGGEVDTTPFRESLAVELDEGTTAAKLLQYALAALLLAEADDDAGQAALLAIAQLETNSADAVVAQVLDAAMRHGFAAAGPLALTIAKDTQCAPALRLLGIQSAMRLGNTQAPQVWQAMFRDEAGSAQRIRLAMVALDSSGQVEPKLFDTLNDNGQWIGHIAEAGRAIASEQDDLAKAFEPLIATGQPLSVQWVLTYCLRQEPAQAPALLDLIIRHYNAGPKHHRGRMSQLAIGATAALCELDQDEALTRLVKLLAPTAKATDREALTLRQIILMGIARAQRTDLGELAVAITPDQHADFSTDALRLFIRARHGADLTDKEWSRVADIVQGVGQFDPSMRLQLGWAYLRHRGQSGQAIVQALR